MKRLLMVRHAKSDWSNLRLKDYDRPLNERGKLNAPAMGKRLLDRNFKVDLIVSSTAKRAASTANRIAKAINYDKSKIEWIKELYHAEPKKIKEVIYQLENKAQCAMVVCHNTGITDFVNSLCGLITQNVPTCGMVAFEIDTDKWENFSNAPIKLIFYDYPRSQD